MIAPSLGPSCCIITRLIGFQHGLGSGSLAASEIRKAGCVRFTSRRLSLKEAHLANPSLELECHMWRFLCGKFSADPGCSLVAELMLLLKLDGIV